MISFRVKDKSNVRIVQKTFLAEVSVLDGVPNLLTLASASNEGPSLRHELVHFVPRHVLQTAERLLAQTAGELLAVNCASSG